MLCQLIPGTRQRRVEGDTGLHGRRHRHHHASASHCPIRPTPVRPGTTSRDGDAVRVVGDGYNGSIEDHPIPQWLRQTDRQLLGSSGEPPLLRAAGGADQR